MAGVEQREIGANGLRFETVLAGPASGEAVILLHGYPQSAEAWRDTLSWLAARGYRGVAPSLRGYSPGANPPNAGAYAMPNLVGDVLGIADALRIDRFHLVGHDWGGALAWMVAGNHPDRVLSLTVLSTPHPLAMAEALRTPAQAMRSSYMAFFRIPRVPEAMLSFANFAQQGLGVRVSGLPRWAWQRDRDHLRRVGIRGPLNWYRGATRGIGRPRRVSVPTLFIWGRHDPFLGRRAAELTEKCVSGEYTFVELNTGHWIAERNADQLRRLLGEHIDAHHAPAPQAAAESSAGPAVKPARKRARRPRKRKPEADAESAEG
ncbi:MAG TPA: alpha/beta hydrolase [Candidatus Dormibacteraeota bacterium]|jgi:pimeloyl-ACP methyl ester carboxylesterase